MPTAPTTPEIRRYQRGDQDQVISLLTRVLPDSQPHNEPLSVLLEKQAHDNLMFVAADDTTLCGFVICGYDGHRGWLYSLAVLPDYRRHGTGRQLVETCLATLRDLGCRKVNLQVRSGNEAVLAFYRRLGFETEPRTSMGMTL